jgi:SAM-dependent methyltransferase
VGSLVNFVTPLHEQIQRSYLRRLMDDKVHCMQVARKFERDYWDGDRRYGYGGYQYIPDRWKPVAEALIERYKLTPGDSVLDIGCGKGYLLYELQKLMPELELFGIDRSKYAIQNKHPKLNAAVMHGRAQHPLPFADKSFSLVISLGTLHNLTLLELAKCLPEIERVGERGYVMVESFRDEAEWFNLCAWCLTAESLMRPEDWEFAYRHFGYTGDYEFIYFK